MDKVKLMINDSLYENKEALLELWAGRADLWTTLKVIEKSLKESLNVDSDKLEVALRRAYKNLNKENYIPYVPSELWDTIEESLYLELKKIGAD